MIESIIGLGIAIGLLPYLSKQDREMELIAKAAKGEKVDIHELASAYWNKYSASRVQNSEWRDYSREEKSLVFEYRERFEKYFSEFNLPIQVKVNSVRPRDFGISQSKRSTDFLSTLPACPDEMIGTVLNVGNTFGFIRPRGMYDQLFFSHDFCEGWDRDSSCRRHCQFLRK